MDYIIDETSAFFQEFMQKHAAIEAFVVNDYVYVENAAGTELCIDTKAQIDIEYPGLFIEAVNVLETNEIAQDKAEAQLFPDTVDVDAAAAVDVSAAEISKGGGDFGGGGASGSYADNLSTDSSSSNSSSDSGGD
jgi:hypothetical protein